MATVRTVGNAFWFSQVLLLFYLSTYTNDWMLRDSALVQYFEITPPIDSLDDVVNLLCSRWAADVEVDHSVNLSVSAASVIEAKAVLLLSVP